MTSPGYPTLNDPSDQRAAPVHPGEELAGKYRIETVIGAGAMGVVVRGWHIELEQAVAVKFLYPEFARNADGAERFRREARAAAKIKNQHVARVLDVGTLESQGIPYIVMEHLDGRDLAQELRQQGPLPVPLAVSYVMQACEAVAEAHERGIIHRDLKPANLFLAEGSHGAHMIKVLDFGISKISGSGAAQNFSLTDTATLMGSPAYMSPEQLESSRNVDGRSDIWSLGVILHELILGQVPFNGDSVPQLVRSILSGARSSLLERDPDLLELEGVVERCLRQEREERFANVGELIEALRPHAGGMAWVGTVAGFSSFSSASPSLASPSLASPSLASPSLASPSLAKAAGDSSQPSLSGTDLPPAVSGTAPGAPAAEGSEHTGAHGVPSAWGNTQRGRHRSWQRQGLTLVLLLGAVGLGAYWAAQLFDGGFQAQKPPPPAATPSQSHLASSPAPAEARPETPHEKAEPAAGAAQAGVLPELGAAPDTRSEPATAEATPGSAPQSSAPRESAAAGAVPDVHVISAARGADRGGAPAAPAAAAPAAASEPRLARPAPAPPAAPAVAQPAASAPAPNKAAGASEGGSAAASSPAASSPTASSPAPGASAPAPGASVPDPGDKPKAEPSPRAGAVDVPDFGGRE